MRRHRYHSEIARATAQLNCKIYIPQVCLMHAFVKNLTFNLGILALTTRGAMDRELHKPHDGVSDPHERRNISQKARRTSDQLRSNHDPHLCTRCVPAGQTLQPNGFVAGASLTSRSPAGRSLDRLWPEGT